MGIELGTLFLVGVGYLFLLFWIAHAADHGRIPERWVNNPWTYTLSLGVYASTWSYYGSVGFADSHGYQFLTIYLGLTLAFTLSPVLLRPILRLTRDFQLTSLADLFAFRYRSQLAGIIVTLFMLLGALPYLALQIRAVTESLRVLSDQVPGNVIALIFCLVMTLFAILFGARHISPRDKHRGLITAIAFETLVKMAAMIALAMAALFGVFSGPDDLSNWISKHPQAVRALYEPVREGPWLTLIFLSFAAAFLLPRQFHMAFAENMNPAHLRVASWGLPAVLLVLNLCVPMLLWGGQFLELDMPPTYYGLGIALHAGAGWLPLLAFLGGLSAASAMIIVTTLALSSMSLNHLLLPAQYPDPKGNLYRRLLQGRRTLIAVIILAAYGFNSALQQQQGLVQLGLISFVAAAQFMPGVVGLLYWRRANRTGFIVGLLGGISVWFVTLILPLLHDSGIIQMTPELRQWTSPGELDKWQYVSFATLSVNSLLFVMFSLLTRQSEAEREAASACCSDAFVPLTGTVSQGSTAQFEAGLSAVLGDSAAKREVAQALSDLNMSRDERRPPELRRLRERIERNLSGLLGPQLAHMIVTQRLRLDAHAKTALADSMRYVEERLEASRSRLRGLNAELDNLRRLQRQILRDLPLGVCALDPNGRIVLWNMAMEVTTSLDSREVTGLSLTTLPEPWAGTLGGFAKASDNHIYRLEVPTGTRSGWFNLHKAAFADTGVTASGQPGAQPGTVILIEDLTDLEDLEAELAHSDRLASIGRLAAGVAHEIGNPVTGIASLAQNLRDETDPAIVRESIEDILEQTKRISGILQTLMSFSRGSLSLHRRERFALCEVIGEAVHLVELTNKGRKIRLDSSCPAGITLEGNRQQLSQVFVNLLKNAAEASPDDSRIDLLARASEAEAIIEIMDQGEGIDEGFAESVFEPFFTTKPTGRGTGLGLALVYKIIQDHEGTIDIDSQRGIGTRVVVTLPLPTGQTEANVQPRRNASS